MEWDEFAKGAMLLSSAFLWHRSVVMLAVSAGKLIVFNVARLCSCCYGFAVQIFVENRTPRCDQDSIRLPEIQGGYILLER